MRTVEFLYINSAAVTIRKGDGLYEQMGNLVHRDGAD